jgi:DNA helicase II / ATP-dependent DNA helicase PcrA
MRFPPFADLDKDQRKIYGSSPSDGSILVVGPPGTGKTVIAAHRTIRLAAKGRPVHLIMFNKVLARYTANFEGYQKNVTIKNGHQFFPNWYKQAFGQSMPKEGQYDLLWEEVRDNIRKCTSKTVMQKLSWGHLVIDEGQDFPQSMYEALMAVVNSPLLEESSKPTLSVFADDNQTITENNSSVPDLIEALNVSVDSKRLWRLDRNYRNSKEIAQLSKYFQVRGSSSVRLPVRESGQLPICVIHPDVDHAYDQVARFVQNNPGREAGVIVFGRKGDVKRAFNKIKFRVEKFGVSCRMQCYVSGRSSGHSDPGALVFDDPPSLTVLHSQSAKGLEFDAVFLVNLNALGAFDESEIDSFKRLYVATSRARDSLFLLIGGSVDDRVLPEIVRLLPSPEAQLSEFITGKGSPVAPLDLNGAVQWSRSAAEFQKNSLSEKNSFIQLSKTPRQQLIPLLVQLAIESFDHAATATIVEERLNQKDGLLDLIVELGGDRVLQRMEKEIRK